MSWRGCAKTGWCSRTNWQDILPWGDFPLEDIRILAERGNLYLQFWEILVKDWDRVNMDQALEWFLINLTPSVNMY